MRRLRPRTVVFLAVAVALVCVWAFRETILLHAPGLIARLRDPIGPPHAVSWAEGPSAPAAPPSASGRPTSW